jgi:hypothetical protein
MKTKILVFILIFIDSFAQQKNSENINFSTKIINDVELSFNNGLKYFVKPANFSNSDLLKLSGIILGTGGLMTIDQEVKSEVNKNQTKFQEDFTKIGKYYGEGYAMVGIPATLYLSGLVFNSDELRATGRILIESLAAAGLTSSLLKIIIGRSRPYTKEGEYKFNFFEFDNIKNSLPSGHTAVAFTISTVLSERIDNIYASIGLYGLASLTAYQRIYSNNHWLSDTFLGAVVGITAGKFFSDLEKSRSSKINLGISPNISNGIGFNFSLQF